MTKSKVLNIICYCVWRKVEIAMCLRVLDLHKISLGGYTGQKTPWLRHRGGWETCHCIHF